MVYFVKGPKGATFNVPKSDASHDGTHNLTYTYNIIIQH